MTIFFSGRAIKVLFESRQKPWDQSPEWFSDSIITMNGHWDSFSIVHTTDRLLSLIYDVGWYGAGAAHPNSYFETYNFALLDRIHIINLKDFFSDDSIALKRINEICIIELCREYWNRVGEKPDERLFIDGAGENFNNFTAFTVSSDHFTFLFSDYQVSSYALGRWSADVYFYDLLDVLKPDGPHTFA